MNSFSFSLKGEGTTGQQLIFRPDDGDEVVIPVPNEIFSSDVEEKFRQEYAILVREGLVADPDPTFSGEITETHQDSSTT